MTALYPTTIKGFTTRTDYIDTVLAIHINDLQDEVNAIETTLGSAPTTGSGWIGTFDQTTTAWTNLKSRVSNIEYGITFALAKVLPSGGTTGQVLSKNSGTAYDAGWVTPAVAVSTGLSGLGTGIAAALAVNVGSAGAPVLLGGALGTPTSGVLTNATGLPLGSVLGFGTGVATFLATPSSANFLTALTTSTGTGTVVFSTSPTLVTPALGTPSSLVLTNATGLPLGSITGLGTGIATFLATPSSANMLSALTTKTGTGSVVFGTSPTLATPVINNGALNYPLLTSPQEVGVFSATAATGTIQFDVLTQGVRYFTSNASSNFALNIRGNAGTTLDSLMSTGSILTLVFMNTNSTTGYYLTGVTVDGGAITLKTQGGTVIASGNANSVDSYTLTILKTASATFTVLVAQTRFA